jgi:molybdenum cofactor cytidylyltransferase
VHGAVVLGAGRSRRFGADKRAAPYGGEPLLLATVRVALAAFDRVAVVLRPGPDPLRDRVAALRRDGALLLVRATGADRGMGASLAAGAAALDRVDALWVLPGDLPAVRPATIAALREALDGHLPGTSVVRPVLAGEPGHPVGFGAALRDALCALDGDAGARSVVAAARLRGELVDLPVTDPGVRADADTPQALAALERLRAGTATKPSAESVDSPRKR